MQHHPRRSTTLTAARPALASPTAPASASEISALARRLLRRPELNNLHDDELLLRLARTTAVGRLLRSRAPVAALDAERLLDAMLIDGRAVLLDVTDPDPREGVLAVRRPAAARDLPRARDMARSLAPLLTRR